jgi:hypothetical protein
MAIFPGDSPVQRYKIKLDLSKQSVELHKITGGSWQAAFTFQQPSPTQVMLPW